MPYENDMQAVIDAARAGVAPLPANPRETPLLVRPDGSIVDLRGFLPTPDRKAGTIVVFDAASFNQVVKDNEGAGNVAIYVDRDPTRPVIEAVLNGHGRSGAGWGDLRVKIEFRHTPQWLKWKSIDGKLLEQVAFAEFIEDNLADIAEPTGAQMLEIATQFHASRSTAMKRGIRLSDGQIQFEHVDNMEAGVGAGNIKVPETITLQLAPMLGTPKYKVPARFRYRIGDGGKLTMGVKLERLEDLMEQVLADVIAGIERSTNVSLLDGKAPAEASAPPSFRRGL